MSMEHLAENLQESLGLYVNCEKLSCKHKVLIRKPMGLKTSPLKTSFLAAVQVLAFKVGEVTKMNFTFLSIF